MRMDKAENRYVTEIMGSTQPDAGAFTGQGVFAGFFIGIRSANTLINGSKAATDASGLNAAQRSALIGLGQTIKALNYWNVMEMRDSIGMPIDLDHGIDAPPAPWRCKPAVLEYINGQIRKYKQDGTLKTLQEKWLGESDVQTLPDPWTPLS